MESLLWDLVQPSNPSSAQETGLWRRDPGSSRLWKEMGGSFGELTKLLA